MREVNKDGDGAKESTNNKADGNIEYSLKKVLSFGIEA